MTKTEFLVAAGCAALLGASALLPGGAFAADADLRVLSNRLDRIERSVSDLQRQGYGGSPAYAGDSAAGGGASAADTQARLSEIEDQMRRLTGRIEELSHRIEQTNQDLQTFKGDTDLRFQDMQQAGGAGTGGAAAASAAQTGAASEGPAPASASGTLGTTRAPANIQPAKAAAPTVTLPNGTPQVKYDFAIDLLKRGQFDQARDAFKQFLSEHPKDALAGNAQYWLGETYYVQAQYKDAADAFLKGYTTYSKSSKAPDSLLKLGMTLSALGQKDAACATFGELGRRFPQASPAVVARNKLERQKAGC